MTVGPKRKEAPTEPLKRAIGLTVRAIAGEHDLEVGFAPGAPEYSPKHVQLPEPSRVPSQREIAVIRGWADSFALTAGCHDVKLHNRLAPASGPARLVFEAAERARVEALGANRMPGMARNLTARIEDYYAHGRFAHASTKEDAPLEDALAATPNVRHVTGPVTNPAGDTALFSGMARLAGHVDVALLPVWGWGPRLGKGHLDPRSAAEAVRLIRPRIAVPIHWGTSWPKAMGSVRPHRLRRLIPGSEPPNSPRTGAPTATRRARFTPRSSRRAPRPARTASRATRARPLLTSPRRSRVWS